MSRCATIFMREGVPGDLRKMWREVVERWRLLHGATAPALVAACPPCQGMSTVRSDRGAENDPDAGSRDDRNLLVLPISQIAKALEPTFVVVENVTAFLRRKVRDPESGEGVSAACLLVRLLAGEYDVYPFVTDLADYGVPQRRKRAFLTFVRRASPAADLLHRIGRAPYPVPSHAPDHGGDQVTLDKALAEFRLPSLDGRNSVSARDCGTSASLRAGMAAATTPDGGCDPAGLRSQCMGEQRLPSMWNRRDRRLIQPSAQHAVSRFSDPSWWQTVGHGWCGAFAGPAIGGWSLHAPPPPSPPRLAGSGAAGPSIPSRTAS